ncbi:MULTISPECIES: flippase [Dorea]|uniref:flippase n=1 Tax=Dorea TaxID=189330 RepID=UPI0022E0D370|nr:flippase [Dorea amylophila]
MSKKSNVSKDATILSISKVLSMIISMLSAMLLSRFRSLAEYGTYSQILTVVNLATAIFMLGLPNSMNYFIARSGNDSERSKFISLYYNVITIMCVIVGAVLYIVLPFITVYYDNKMLYNFGYILFLLPWTQIIIGGLSNMLVASGNTMRVLIYNLLRGLALLIIILIVQILGQTFSQYMIYYICVETFFSVWVYIEAKKISNKWYWRLDTKLLKSVFSFSIPMGLASAISTLSVQLDQLMVGRFFSTEELAVFSNAAKELPFTIISSAFTAVLVPKMAKMFKEDRNNEAVQVWKKSVELNAIIIFFCATTCIVFAPYIMTLLYSKKYILGVSVFRIYGLVLITRITYFGMVLNAKGKSKFIMYSSICSLLLNFILNYIGMKLFGMVGAALATLLSLGIMGYVQLLFSSHVLKLHIRDIFPWRKLAELLVLNCTWGIVAFITLKIVANGVDLHSITKAIIVGAVFACVYVLCIKKKFICLYKEIGKF